MDPNATLARMMVLSTRIMSTVDQGKDPSRSDADELAECVDSLNEWVKRGGCLPTAWVQS